MAKKILITYVEAGMGHITTAQAIADALKQYPNEDVEIIEKNIFHTHEKLKKYEQFLINETKKASSNMLHSRTQLLSMCLKSREICMLKNLRKSIRT